MARRLDWQHTRGELCRIALDLIEALATYEFPAGVERRVQALRQAVEDHEQTVLKYQIDESKPLRPHARRDRRAR
jgi:hypothetical protein